MSLKRWKLLNFSCRIRISIQRILAIHSSEDIKGYFSWMRYRNQSGPRMRYRYWLGGRTLKDRLVLVRDWPARRKPGSDQPRMPGLFQNKNTVSVSTKNTLVPNFEKPANIPHHNFKIIESFLLSVALYLVYLFPVFFNPMQYY